MLAELLIQLSVRKGSWRSRKGNCKAAYIVEYVFIFHLQAI